MDSDEKDQKDRDSEKPETDEEKEMGMWEEALVDLRQNILDMLIVHHCPTCLVYGGHKTWCGIGQTLLVLDRFDW